ncbi:hypothetical protein Ferp_1373 [Ferroglobus placidus DSM 10642]|uniref:Uncharacterized protein n=2 Tax=Ferroglobus placidus TaxID=54261 RepID=D3RYG1_FERPA|nr:hypothetical protein Ferp_1373 [Ferroglobus placidus DSM 10642]
MHGSWSIWLISTSFAFLIARSFDPLIFLVVALFLFSVEPAYGLISERKVDRSLLIPAVFTLSLMIIAVTNKSVIPFILVYSLILALQIKFKDNLGAFTGIGSIVMTFPFPLITAYFSIDFFTTLRALIFLVLVVLFSYSLVLYRNKNKKTLALTFLTLLLIYSFSPTIAYGLFLIATALLFLAVKRISLKGVGKSLLTYQFFSILIYQFLFL